MISTATFTGYRCVVWFLIRIRWFIILAAFRQRHLVFRSTSHLISHHHDVDHIYSCFFSSFFSFSIFDQQITSRASHAANSTTARHTWTRNEMFSTSAPCKLFDVFLHHLPSFLRSFFLVLHIPLLKNVEHSSESLSVCLQTSLTCTNTAAQLPTRCWSRSASFLATLPVERISHGPAALCSKGLFFLSF